MTDPRVFKQKMEQASERFEKGVTEPPPENWQAIAMMVIDGLSQQVKELQFFIVNFRIALSRDDPELFRSELENLEAWAKSGKGN